MVRATQSTQLWPSTAPATCLVRTLLRCALLALMGCAVQDYSPPLLPTFTQEQTSAGVTPLVEQDDLDKPFARASRSVPTQTVPVPTEPGAANSSGEMASASDTPQSGEPSSL